MHATFHHVHLGSNLSLSVDPERDLDETLARNRSTNPKPQAAATAVLQRPPTAIARLQNVGERKKKAAAAAEALGFPWPRVGVPPRKRAVAVDQFRASQGFWGSSCGRMARAMWGGLAFGSAWLARRRRRRVPANIARCSLLVCPNAHLHPSLPLLPFTVTETPTRIMASSAASSNRFRQGPGVSSPPQRRGLGGKGGAKGGRVRGCWGVYRVGHIGCCMAMHAVRRRSID